MQLFEHRMNMKMVQSVISKERDTNSLFLPRRSKSKDSQSLSFLSTG